MTMRLQSCCTVHQKQGKRALNRSWSRISGILRYSSLLAAFLILSADIPRVTGEPFSSATTSTSSNGLGLPAGTGPQPGATTPAAAVEQKSGATTPQPPMSGKGKGEANEETITPQKYKSEGRATAHRTPDAKGPGEMAGDVIQPAHLATHMAPAQSHKAKSDESSEVHKSVQLVSLDGTPTVAPTAKIAEPSKSVSTTTPTTTPTPSLPSSFPTTVTGKGIKETAAEAKVGVDQKHGNDTAARHKRKEIQLNPPKPSYDTIPLGKPRDVPSEFQVNDYVMKFHNHGAVTVEDDYPREEFYIEFYFKAPAALEMEEKPQTLVTASSEILGTRTFSYSIDIIHQNKLQLRVRSVDPAGNAATDALQSTEQWTPGNWTHVYCEWNGNDRFAIYVNTREAGSIKPPKPGSQLAKAGDLNWLTFGRSYDETLPGNRELVGWFDGWMTEVRLWNGPRSKEDLIYNIARRISANAEKDKLRGYWPLNNGKTVDGLRPRSTPDMINQHKDGTLSGNSAFQKVALPMDDRLTAEAQKVNRNNEDVGNLPDDELDSTLDDIIRKMNFYIEGGMEAVWNADLYVTHVGFTNPGEAVKDHIDDLGGWQPPPSGFKCETGIDGRVIRSPLKPRAFSAKDVPLFLGSGKQGKKLDMPCATTQAAHGYRQPPTPAQDLTPLAEGHCAMATSSDH